MEVGGQHHAPAALPPEKARYPLYRRLGRPQGRFGRVRIISPPPGFDPRTVQPVASRYTDWAIPAATARYRRHVNNKMTISHRCASFRFEEFQSISSNLEWTSESMYILYFVLLSSTERTASSWTSTYLRLYKQRIMTIKLYGMNKS